MIHVRGLIRPRPLPPVDTSSARARRDSTQLRWIAECDPANQPAPMGLPFAGELLTYPTLHAMRDQIGVLCGLGYHVPASVLEGIDIELTDYRLSTISEEIVG
ncbi:hypothetical protein [Pseudoxanthomonas kaohsiungensis]|uniref:hypothetical protein n=1 Tax=Pseudoxanthomonas kaohsiungensis TaxID=283923 RepID=UPI001390E417|nr:hypothetical protein [Pseudoxanthomonas kaohsiungensis]